MAQYGNAARWHFLSYISCGQVITVLKLMALEVRVIKQFLNSLNRMTFPRATRTSVQDGMRVLYAKVLG